MIWEPVVIGIVFLVAFFVWYTYHQNAQFDRSWKKRHQQFLDNIDLRENPKAFYSKKLLERLVPALTKARGWGKL